jgi:hypothetical protein
MEVKKTGVKIQTSKPGTMKIKGQATAKPLSPRSAALASLNKEVQKVCTNEFDVG